MLSGLLNPDIDHPAASESILILDVSRDPWLHVFLHAWHGFSLRSGGILSRNCRREALLDDLLIFYDFEDQLGQGLHRAYWRWELGKHLGWQRL